MNTNKKDIEEKSKLINNIKKEKPITYYYEKIILDVKKETKQYFNDDLNDDDISLSTIISIATYIVKILSKKKINGYDKKKILIFIIDQIIDETNLDDDAKEVIKTQVDLFLPAIIDNLVIAYETSLKDCCIIL